MGPAEVLGSDKLGMPVVAWVRSCFAVVLPEAARRDLWAVQAAMKGQMRFQEL